MAKKQFRRLPRNFHKTFKPERQYINAMLRYAASGQSGDYQEIARATGIPTGASSGKVPAILDYCQGMGLIQLVGPERSAVKKPELTSFGRIVLLEDPFLKCSVTQWIAHLNLCGPLTGADVWHQTFFAGAPTLGQNFAREKLESYLGVVYGTLKGGLIGPLIGTYEDEAAFKLCGALSESAGAVTRKPAPIENELGRAYGAWLVQLMADHFPKQQQVPLTDLDSAAGWRTIPGWDSSAVLSVMQLFERKALVEVDRHMEPWLISVRIKPAEAWRNIYLDVA